MKRFRNKFLMRKMTEIGTGLFYNFSEGLMKTPTSIIQIRNSDRQGNLYFEIPRPYKDMEAIDSKFFSKIQFFNRRCNMHVMAEGYATILNDHRESESVLIQFHLSEAYGMLHRKNNLIGLSGWIQRMSVRLSEDHNSEPAWIPLPA